VTDDASTDGTYKVLKHLSEIDLRVRVFRNKKNIGAGPSRNCSIENARGKYLAFIDADDLWCADKLGMQLAIHQAGARISFTGYEVIDKDNISRRQYIDCDAGRDTYGYWDLIYKKVVFGCSTVMVNSELVAGKRMPDLRTGQDYSFWLQLLRDGEPAYKLPIPLTKYRITKNSISRNKFKKALRQWEIYRKYECLSLGVSVMAWLSYSVRASIQRLRSITIR